MYPSITYTAVKLSKFLSFLNTSQESQKVAAPAARKCYQYTPMQQAQQTELVKGRLPLLFKSRGRQSRREWKKGEYSNNVKAGTDIMIIIKHRVPNSNFGF